MNRTRVTSLHKIAPASVVAVLLLCTPLQLTAQERETRAGDQVSTIEWLTSLWDDLTVWLAGDLVPALPEPSDNRTDNSCAIDPNGGCGG